ncbi:MAG: phosphohistidine phosphatase SixA [Candidatus Omnitrophota bacterium]
MKLYFLRHAEAIEKIPGMEDKDRPLTSFGAATMSNLAKFLKGDSSGLDTVLTSPLLRAIQTADIVANTFGCKDRVSASENLLVGTPPEVLLDELKSYKSSKSILLVGHQPHIGIVISFLTGVKESDMNISKGSCALVEIEDLKTGSGRLVWIKDAQDLK